MRNPPARRARKQLRAARLQALRRNLSLVAIAFGVLVAVGVLLLLLPTPLWVRTFELGLLVAGIIAAVLWGLHLSSGTHSQYLGKAGEDLTAQAALGTWRRLTGWHLVNGLYFAEHGDVDHVLVGPGGVFVLESKWTTGKWEVSSDRIIGPSGRDPVAQARNGVHKISLVLRHGRQRLDLTPIPVVVIWGPGAPAIGGGRCSIRGVEVIEGRRFRRARGFFSGQTLDKRTVRLATEILEQMLARQLKREAADEHGH